VQGWPGSGQVQSASGKHHDEQPSRSSGLPSSQSSPNTSTPSPQFGGRVGLRSLDVVVVDGEALGRGASGTAIGADVCMGDVVMVTVGDRVDSPELLQARCVQTCPVSWQSSESLHATRQAPTEHSKPEAHCSSWLQARSSGKLHTPSPGPTEKHAPLPPHSSSLVHSARHASNAHTPARQSSVVRHAAASFFDSEQEPMSIKASKEIRGSTEGFSRSKPL
jgi:hypothetical protein